MKISGMQVIAGAALQERDFFLEHRKGLQQIETVSNAHELLPETLLRKTYVNLLKADISALNAEIEYIESQLDMSIV